jgi:cytidylate kinase
MNLIMLAPPGAGKGTHCSWLTQETGVAHISSGDLLRAEIGTATALGRRLGCPRGDLVHSPTRVPPTELSGRPSKGTVRLRKASVDQIP